MSAASMIAAHLNAPYGPLVSTNDVEESLRNGELSASTPAARDIMEDLFVECGISLIERAAREMGLPLEQVQLLQRSIDKTRLARIKQAEDSQAELHPQSFVVQP